MDQAPRRILRFVSHIQYTLPEESQPAAGLEPESFSNSHPNYLPQIQPVRKEKTSDSHPQPLPLAIPPPPLPPANALYTTAYPLPSMTTRYETTGTFYPWPQKHQS